jgi:sigma-B regulation protein RsbU (phosphoserine phosphatase)
VNPLSIDPPEPSAPAGVQSRQARAGRRRRVVLWSVGLALGLVWGLAAVFLKYEREEVERGQLGRAELYAKVLEGHTTRELGAAAARVAATANLVALKAAERPEGAGLQALLRDALVNQPTLRSLSLVNTEGRVLASSNPDNVGHELAWPTWGGLPAREGRALLGPLVPLRDLADAAAGPARPGAAGAWPMAFRFESSDGRALVLLALLNPDYFSNQHEVILDDPRWRAAVLRLDGMLIAATESVTPPRDASPARTQAIGDLQRNVEQGRYVGAGLDGHPAITAYRASRLWPVVSVVEQHYSEVDRRFKFVFDGALALALLLSACVVLAGWALLRSERREALADLALAEREAQVQASEARKEAILRSALDGIVTIDGQGTVLDVNPSAEAMFGYRHTDMVGKPMHELIVPARLRAAHEAGLARYRAEGVPRVLGRRIEIEAQRASGEEFPVELTIVPVRTAEGEIFTATLRDITERRRAELERNTLLERIGHALTDLQRQRLALDEHAIVSIADDRGNITYANSKLARVSGHAVEDLVGSSFPLVAGDAGTSLEGSRPVLWRADATADTRATILERLGAGRVWEGELLHVRKDGRPFWAASTLVPMRNEQGALDQVFIIQTDITQRIEAERKVAEARELEVQIGGRIQQALLVTRPDQRLPQTWVSGFSRPSRGIDGDFVEVLAVGEHCVDIVVGDVMGKGVGAALIGAATKMQLGHCVAELMTTHHDGAVLPQPVAVLSALHRAMTPSLRGIEAFVTLCYLRIDSKADTVTWVGCGHEEPLLLSAQGTCLRLSNQHPPLGVLDVLEYEQHTLPLTRGDGLFVCSDGIYDALRPDGSRVGGEAVQAKVQSLMAQHRTPAAVLQRLRCELLGSEVRATDDMTMLLALRTGPTAAESRRELSASLDSLQHVRGLVGVRAVEAGMAETVAGLFTVACVEAFTNVVRHATGREPDMPIELVVTRKETELHVEFIYLGDAFEPPAEIAETCFDDYPEGGFGLSIIRQASDRVDYEHRDGVNTVRLVRYL